MPRTDPYTGRVIVERKNVVRRSIARRASGRTERGHFGGNPEYAIGLDLAQVRDYSAVAIVERIVAEDCDNMSATRPPEYHVRHLSRFELGTPYPTIVEHVGKLLEHQELCGRTRLVLDRTGVGAPVADMFLRAGFDPLPICFTGGHSITTRGRTLCVPRNYFISTLQILLQTHRLEIADSLTAAPILEGELLRFSLRHRPADDELAESWRENDHDDLVFALAMACYYFERRHSGNAVAARARTLG